MGRKHSGSGRSAAVSADVRNGLNVLVGGLTDSDEHIRYKAVATVLAVALPVLRGMLADRLVDRLADDSEVVRRQAAASLIELGGAVTAALVLRLHKAQRAEVRDRLMEILYQIAQKLPEAEGAGFQLDLLLADLMAAAPPSWRRPRRGRRRPAQMDDGAA
jgi:hypothetical protein